MKPLAIAASLLACLLAVGGCAGTAPAPPGTVVTAARAQAVQPGVTTRAQLLAELGATSTLRFDSGYEVWRYLTPGAGGLHGEFVLVLAPDGVVARTRSAPTVYRAPAQK